MKEQLKEIIEGLEKLREHIERSFDEAIDKIKNIPNELL